MQIVIARACRPPCDKQRSSICESDTYTPVCQCTNRVVEELILFRPIDVQLGLSMCAIDVSTNYPSVYLHLMFFFIHSYATTTISYLLGKCCKKKGNLLTWRLKCVNFLSFTRFSYLEAFSCNRIHTLRSLILECSIHCSGHTKFS